MILSSGVFCRIERIKTLTHKLSNPDRQVHETYFVCEFWKSEELAKSGVAPHWIEDFHTQPHVLLNHPVSPAEEIKAEIELTYHLPEHAGKQGDNRNHDFLARANDGDPHGILAHPSVKALRQAEGIA